MTTNKLTIEFSENVTRELHRMAVNQRITPTDVIRRALTFYEEKTREYPLHSWSRDRGFKPLLWSMVEQWRDQIEQNHGQTLEGLAGRGGLAHDELYCAAHGLRLTMRHTEETMDKWMHGRR